MSDEDGEQVCRGDEAQWHQAATSFGGDTEKKWIVLPELSCRTAAEPPPPDCRRSFGGSPAAIEAIRPPPKLWRQSGGVLRELICRRSFPAALAGVLREMNCSGAGSSAASPAV
ncbi:unnamed protein product [Boreogadus saida]